MQARKPVDPRPRSIAWLVLLLFVATACGERQTGLPDGQASPAMAEITGSVFYRERIMLPPGAEVAVELQDISRADAPARVVAEARLTPASGPPYRFTISYDPAQIDGRLQYALRASIHLEGRLLFTNTDYIDAFADGPIEIMVTRVPDRPHAAQALEGVEWVLQTLGGAPAGMGAGGRAAFLVFDAQEGRVAGFAGCNRFTGGYSREGSATDGSPLTLGPLGATMMACPEGMELERQFLQMLEQVSAFRLEAGNLVLVGEAGVLATFIPGVDAEGGATSP
jgi:putative lipoprotein